MHSLLSANEYLLQSAGWAIINSFWQVGLLWIAYEFIVSINTKSSPVFKHNLSVVFLFASLLFFFFTIIETYISLTSLHSDPILLFNSVHFINVSQLDKLLPYLSSIYIILLFFYAMHFIGSYQKIDSLRKKNLLKAPIGLRVFTKNTALHIGIKKDVQVWLSEHIDVPSVIGFAKPLILLPIAAINHLSADQLEAVLLHELAHIKRNDYFINLLQSIVETILFFNPFVILLSKHAKKERENCCDDWVMNYQYNKHQYASALLQLEEQRRQHLLLAIAATNKKELLLKRIKRLFNSEPQTNINIFQKLQIASICIVLFVGIACLFLSPSTYPTSGKDKNIAPANTFFIRHPSIFIYPTGNKEVVNTENNRPLKNDPIITNEKKGSEKHTVNKTNTDYTLAVINADFLKNNKQLVTTMTNVVDKEPDLAKEYYIKVEEEQSGDEQMNIYYFDLKKDSGKTTVEPILLLKEPIHKKEIKKLYKHASSVKERITA